MPTVSGESSIPLGRSGTGAAYVLGSGRTPDALSIILQGDRTRALHAQPHQARAVKARATPTVKAQTSPYYQPSSAAPAPNHYAAVGHYFGSAAKPYVEVEASNADMDIVGQHGEAIHLNRPSVNGRAPVRLVSRACVLYANGNAWSGPKSSRPTRRPKIPTI
jgi:hypothetical protein